MFSWGPIKGRVHPAGWPFIALVGAVGVFLTMFSGAVGFFVLLFSLGIAAFFREPVRVVPSSAKALVSPADGLLVSIQKASPPPELGGYAAGDWTRFSIFLSIFDVHVNRIPETGRVLATLYHKGQFLNASLDKASDKNERNSVVIETKNGPLIVTQIAGLLARRIQCEVSIGDMVSRGDVFGIIRFGSRVDLYVPSGVKVVAQKGQRMVGGETVLASY